MSAAAGGGTGGADHSSNASMHDDMQHNRDIDDDDDMRAPPEEVPEPKSGKLKTHFPQSSNFMDELMSLKKSKSMTRAAGKNYQT